MVDVMGIYSVKH